MRILLTGILPFLPLVAGCLAFSGEAANHSGMIDLNWGSMVTVYGPMIIMIGWLMYREKKRDERLFLLVEKCTEVMTKVEMSLSRATADDDKNRAAIYRQADEIKDLRAEIIILSGSTPVRNTRIMTKE